MLHPGVGELERDLGEPDLEGELVFGIEPVNDFG